MVIDIHIHEKTWSPDSTAELTAIVDCARKSGMQGICITDHDNNYIRDYAWEMAAKTGMLIITGCEVYTFDGDILVFGTDELPQCRTTAEELSLFVAERGGVTVAAHPYRDNGRGLGDKALSVAALNGIEVFNGNTAIADNLRAVALLANGLPALGGSDAHRLEEVGRYATFFEEAVSCEADFVRAIRSGKCAPVRRTDYGYEKLKYNTGRAV